MPIILLIFLYSFNIPSSDSLDSERIPEESLQGIFEIGTVQSLMIQQDGVLIHESFKGSASPNRPVNIKSASKSVISLLIGIAIDQGYLEGTNQTIDQFFPEYFDQNPDSIKESLTLQDLLTMRTGLDTTSSRNYGRWAVSNSWIRFALNQPIVEEPGGRMIYSTGTSHLLSVILTRATGMSTLAFANQYLFNPMDISVGGWDRGPEGYYMGGNNMALSPSDLLKLGELMINVGKYGDQQIVSKEWVIESTQNYARSNYNPYNYGYMWWNQIIANYTVFFAWGNGGQYILILPELNSAISITSSLSSNGSRRYQREIFRFLGDVIIPFIENRNG